MKKKHIHVLIVDAHTEDAERLERMLSSAGVAAHVRPDPATALDAFTTYQPDLVLVDEVLAKHDKTHISRQFAGSDLGRRVPIVLMSRSEKERRKRTRALNANGYSFHLRKPVQPDELLDMLMSLVPEALVIDISRGAREESGSPASSRPSQGDETGTSSRQEQPEGALISRRTRD